MAKTKTASKSTAKKGGTTKTNAKTRGATESKIAEKADGPGKRELQRAEDAKRRERVVELRSTDPKTSWGDIAEELSITPGKAQFLMMQHEVETTPKLRIKHTDDDSLVAGIRAAREANDAHSSWGWIAARTGVSEGKVKKVAEEAGIPVSGTNVAVARSEANGGPKKADVKTKTQASTKGSSSSKKGGSGKAAAAKKRAASRAGKS